MTKDEVRNEVRSAFLGAPPPKGESLISHDCEECRALQDEFAGRAWHELDPDTIGANYDKLPLFNREAFRYYLPAYLIEALEDDDSDVRQFTIFELSLPRNEWRDERWREFNEPQIRAVLSVLQLLGQSPRCEFIEIEREDILAAIRMWERQLTELNQA